MRILNADSTPKSSSVFSSDGAVWVAKAREVIEAHEAGTPQFRLGGWVYLTRYQSICLGNPSPGLWREFFHTPSYHKFFVGPEETTWKYVLPATAGDVVTRALSKSYIAVLPEDERKKVADSLMNILETEKKSWINEAKGVFEYPYGTTVVIVHRK